MTKNNCEKLQDKIELYKEIRSVIKLENIKYNTRAKEWGFEDNLFDSQPFSIMSAIKKYIVLASTSDYLFWMAPSYIYLGAKLYNNFVFNLDIPQYIIDGNLSKIEFDKRILFFLYSPLFGIGLNTIENLRIDGYQEDIDKMTATYEEFCLVTIGEDSQN